MLDKRHQSLKGTGTLIALVQRIVEALESAVMQSVEISQRCPVDIFRLDAQISRVNPLDVGSCVLRVAGVAKTLIRGSGIRRKRGGGGGSGIAAFLPRRDVADEDDVSLEVVVERGLKVEKTLAEEARVPRVGPDDRHRHSRQFIGASKISLLFSPRVF